MEKINNYISFELKQNAHPNTNGTPWGWIHVDRLRVATWSGSKERNLCELLLKRNEQHFKMLEALKQIASWQSQEYITDIIELAEQTIKECEL